MSQPLARAVFLDRDGTINAEYPYIFQPERVELLPQAASAIADLRRAGLKIVVVTNQSSIGRGFALPNQVIQTNNRLQELLLAQDPDALLDLVLFSGDVPGTDAPRRKPNPGMLLEAQKALGISFSHSWMIGDKESDIEAGVRASIPRSNCLLVLTGHGKQTLEDYEQSTIEVKNFPDIRVAANHILHVLKNEA